MLRAQCLCSSSQNTLPCTLFMAPSHSKCPPKNVSKNIYNLKKFAPCVGIENYNFNQNFLKETRFFDDINS